MRRTQRILLVSLLSSLCTTEALAQAPIDARATKPAVMLLVDTSGSMERLPATSSTEESPLPTCTGIPAQDSLQKNRWSLTLEALTGSFQSYTCREQDRSGTGYTPSDYDYGYYLPHIDIGTNPPQNTDGILDSFANRVKFGLMTFDGVGTTINGETLVSYYDMEHDLKSQVEGAPGLYSYGDVKRLSFPGCEEEYGVNAGARGLGNHPGALVSVGRSENNDDILAINATIQASLLAVRPYGGTPIPAMLDDLRHYLTTNDDIRSGGDSFYVCRDRTAILITDGAPDALFRDSRFQCDQPEDGGLHDTCAEGDAGVSDAGTPSVIKKCSCPYELADTIAADLVGTEVAGKPLLKKLIVVAYNVQDPEALRKLNEIARAGWIKPGETDDPKKRLGTAPYDYLLRANGPDELRELLDKEVSANDKGVTSRSVPISVNAGDATSGADSRRFDVTAGFQAPAAGDNVPWVGYLYRRRVECQTTAGVLKPLPQDIDVNKDDDLAVSLNSRTPSQRDLFTVVPQAATDVNGTLRNGSYVPAPVYPTDDTNFDRDPLSTGYDPRNQRRPDGSTFSAGDAVASDTSMSSSQGRSVAITNAGDLRASFTNALSPQLFGSTMVDADRLRIVNYVRGDSRPGRMLADIYHSNPVALLPLNSASTSRFADINAAYSNWLRKLIAPGSGARYGANGRPGIVFVGTNDGVLHAFNLEDWESGSGDRYAGGHELWGFIPPALFGKMSAMSMPSHQFMFDGTPEVKDVVLQWRHDGSGPPIFRTVLVSSVRGAPAYVALDVTYPETPVFLWQASFPDVGETIGNVAVTQVEVDWLGEHQQRAVAILPGGRGLAAGSCPPGGHALVDGVTRAAYPTGNTRNVRCWQRRGRALYVVDVATGQLLQEFGPEHFPSPLTGSVVVDSAGVGTASAAYFYDQDGVLWRLSMIGTDPKQWRAAPLFDMFAGMAAPSGYQTWEIGRAPQYPPALTRDRQGNLVLLAGTGDADNPLDTTRQRVVSLTEKRTAAGDGQIAGTLVHNWSINMDANEAVTGPLTVFENIVYFGTFTSAAGTANMCSQGVSKLYGTHAFDPVDPLVRPGLPQHKLVADDAQPGDAPVLYDELDGDGLVLGLTISRQPICRSNTQLINAITQQSSGGATSGGMYELRAMMGPNSSGDVDDARGAQTSEMTPREIPVSYPASVSAWAGSVE